MSNNIDDLLATEGAAAEEHGEGASVDDRLARLEQAVFQRSA